jgi:hypothetical protein
MLSGYNLIYALFWGYAMKKLWMVLLVLLVIGIGTAGAQVWTSNAPAFYQLQIRKNQWSPGCIGVIMGTWVFNRQQIKAGEKYEVEMTFKSNREFTGMSIVIVDASEKADWWTELTEYADFEEAFSANTEFTKKITFITIGGSTDSSNLANQIAVSTLGSPNDRTVTLTFSKFTITRVQ